MFARGDAEDVVKFFKGALFGFGEPEEADFCVSKKNVNLIASCVNSKNGRGGGDSHHSQSDNVHTGVKSKHTLRSHNFEHARERKRQNACPEIIRCNGP